MSTIILVFILGKSAKVLMFFSDGNMN